MQVPLYGTFVYGTRSVAMFHVQYKYLAQSLWSGHRKLLYKTQLAATLLSSLRLRGKEKSGCKVELLLML